MTTPYKETHQIGRISIENLETTLSILQKEKNIGDFGVQIAKDGRIWICINGVAFIRFSPHPDGKMHQTKGKPNGKEKGN
jgi:hypothetical protein